MIINIGKTWEKPLEIMRKRNGKLPGLWIMEHQQFRLHSCFLYFEFPVTVAFFSFLSKTLYNIPRLNSLTEYAGDFRKNSVLTQFIPQPR